MVRGRPPQRGKVTRQQRGVGPAEPCHPQDEQQTKRDLEALVRLNQICARLWQTQDLRRGLEEMLVATVELLGADFGNVQLFDARDSVLRIVAQRGFKRKFLHYFAEVSTKDNVACGRALRMGRRILIEDVEMDAGYAPYRAIARSAGYRAVQSTPLVSRDGRPLGMITTHFRQPHRPHEMELARLDLYAQTAASFIESCRADEALRASEKTERARANELEAILNTAPIGLAIARDPKGHQIRGNRANEMIFGLPSGGEFSKAGPAPARFRVFRDGKELKLTELPMQRAVRGEIVAGEEMDVLREDGGKVSVYANAVPLLDEKGMIRGAVGTFLDITERRLATQALQQANERNVAVLESISDGFFAMDQDLRVTFFNRAAETLLGRPGCDVIGRKLFEAFPEAKGSVFEKEYVRAVQIQQSVAFETYFDVPPFENWYEVRVFPAHPGASVYFSVITARKQAEEALRISEERYRTLVTSTSAVTWSCPSSGLHVAPQASWMAFTGQTADEMLGAGWLKAVHPDDAAKAAQGWSDAVAQGKAYSGEHRIRRHDGQWRWMAVHATPLRDATGKIVEWFGMNLDITASKQSEEARRVSERRLQVAQRIAGIGHWEWDLRSGRATWSPEIYTMHGLGPDTPSFTPDALLAQVHVDDVERVKTILAGAIDHGIPADVEYRVSRPDGSIRVIHALGEVTEFDARGKPAKMVGITQDITERRKLDESLRESENRLRAIVDTAVEGIIIIDEQGVIESMNPAALKMFCYAAKEIIGSNINVLMPSPHLELHDGYLANYLRTGQKQIIGIGREVVGRRKDGEEIPIDLSVTEIALENRRKFCGFVRDISESKRLQQALLDTMEREQRKFGHELHDGLGQRLTGLEMMSHRLTQELKNEAAHLTENAKRLNSELRETVTQARLISHGLSPVPLIGEGLMRGLSELAAGTTRTTGVSCRFICDSPVEVHDPSTANHLYRIAQEAVNNAVKHGRPTRLNITLTERDSAIEIIVANNGRPLPAKTTSPKTGMGCSVMRYRAAAIGAVLTVESGPRRGVKVICRLPTRTP